MNSLSNSYLANRYTAWRRESIGNHNSKSNAHFWAVRVVHCGWDDELQWQANDHLMTNRYAKQYRLIAEELYSNGKNGEDTFDELVTIVNAKYDMWVYVREYTHFTDCNPDLEINWLDWCEMLSYLEEEGYPSKFDSFRGEKEEVSNDSIS